MRIVMTTHDRRPNYRDESLRSLFASDMPKDQIVQLSVHEPSLKCIDTWMGHPQLHVRDLLPEEATEKNQLALRAKIVHATKIALSLEPGEVLLLQDDVKFLPDWWARLQVALATLTDRDNTCLTLYSHLWGDPGTRPIEAAKWWGLQGMFFGENARLASVASLKLQPMDYMKDGKRDGADLRMASMFMAQEGGTRGRPLPADDVRIQQMILKHPNIKLWGTFPSLVQHTGKVSSIGSIMHGSPTYGDRKPLRMSSPQHSGHKSGGHASSLVPGPVRPPRMPKQ
jgi:hypothetical protein